MAFGSKMMGALVSVFAAIPVTTAMAQSPVISEIFYNAPAAATDEDRYEWFEIYNPGPGELSLSGLVVHSGQLGGTTYLASIPPGTADLPANSYAVLAKELWLSIDCGTAGVQS